MLGGARPPIIGGKGEAEAACPRNQKLGDVEGADSRLPTSSPSAIGDLYPAKRFFLHSGGARRPLLELVGAKFGVVVMAPFTPH